MADSTTKLADGAEKIFPPFDFTTLPSQLLWLVVTFGIFYFLMAKLVLPRLASILETRSDRIAQDLEEANKLQGESDEAHKAYEQELASAKANASTIAQQASTQAKSKLEQQQQELDYKFQQQMQQSEEKILAAKNKAMENLQEIAKPTVQAVLLQVLNKQASEQEIVSEIDKVKGSK